jgi:hypothetical protein
MLSDGEIIVTPAFSSTTITFLYLDASGDASRRNQVDEHAYALMTNHVHLLSVLRTPGGITRVMQSIGR